MEKIATKQYSETVSIVGGKKEHIHVELTDNVKQIRYNKKMKRYNKNVSKRKVREIYDNFAKQFFTGSGLFIVVILLGIFVMLLVTALPAFKEINIFNFADDIYGKEIIVKLVHYIRGEHKFNSPSALTEQMQNDQKIISAYFSKKEK